MKKLNLEELGRISVQQFKLAEKLPVAILLDNIRSLHNVGSVFRTADAFRLDRIMLAGITGRPPRREIHKTALGATESVDWSYHEQPGDAAREMKKNGYRIVVVEQTTESIPLQEFQILPGERICLAFGNEIHGVSEAVIECADRAVEIPQAGTKHSLNISVCAGIVCWQIFKQLRL